MVQTSVRPRRTPDGYRLEVTAEFDASPATAWELLVDTWRWPDWGPSVRAVECDDRRIRHGTTGRVQTPVGLWVPFEVTSYDPHDRRWTWRVAKIPATGHRVEATPGGCRVAFELHPLAAGYVLVCRTALGNMADLLGE